MMNGAILKLFVSFTRKQKPSERQSDLAEQKLEGQSDIKLGSPW